MNVIFSPEASEYLADLIEILYDNDYLGFKDSAKKYVEELVINIKISINNKSKKKAPAYFNRYGKGLYYAVFKKNDNTQWYVFFNYEDDIYYIRYIGNNHTCAQYL
ncbi:hypothetical protein [Dysgonomonas sp.]